MTRLTKVAMLACVGAVLGCGAQDKITIHVSPSGDDANRGTVSSPLKTLDGARLAVRKAKAEPRKVPLKEIEVLFHDGVYPISTAVAFDAEDSSAAGQKIVYRAANRGGAIFDGGIKLDWKPLSDGDPAAKLIPAAVRGKVKTAAIPQEQELPSLVGGRKFFNPGPAWLYANGKAAPIAAWPNASDDWAKLRKEFAEADFTQEMQKQDKKNPAVLRFVCKEKAKIPLWTKEPDLWIYGLWAYAWDDATSQIVEADAETGVVAIDKKQVSPGCEIGKHGRLYRVINALSEMDSPGEWAIDRKGRRAYRYDDGAEPTMSSARQLVCATNLANVVFDGFGFRHSRLTAVRFDDCRSIRVRGCTISECGGHGVILARGSDNRVEGCDVHHMGEGGIMLFGGDRRTLTRCDNAAVNNHVHHWGERLPMYRPAIGIREAGDGVNVYCCGGIIEHNLIHHGRHEAIHYAGNLNEIRWNMIHDVCACSEDCGAIYGYNETDWALSRGTLIEHNCIYMTGYPGARKCFHVIYVDGFVAGVTARKNLCIVGDVGLFSQFGQANVYEQNVVVLCSTAACRNNYTSDTGSGSGLWTALQRDKAMFQSEPWKSHFPELAEQAAMTNCVLGESALFTVFRDNVFAESGTPVWQSEAKLSKYSTITNNLRVAGDPGFVDYFNCDWNLKPDSAAYRIVGDLGFGRMGITNGADRASAAVRFGEGITKPPELKIPLPPALTRIDLVYSGPEKFSEERPLAKDTRGCEIAQWDVSGKRIVGDSSAVGANGKWAEYEMAFTPTVSCKLTVVLMGSVGLKTCMDDIRVEGAELLNGGFETDGHWSSPSVYDSGRSDITKPYGMTESTALNRAPEGKRFVAVNHDINLRQNINVEAGKRVVIKWRATAFRK